MKITKSKILKLLKNRYGINKSLVARKLKSGQAEVFEIITREESYILKLYPLKKGVVDELKIKETIRLLLFLKKRRFPYEVPTPIPKIDETYIIKWGNYLGILYKKIKGKNTIKLNIDIIKEIAKLQAEFHKATVNFKTNKEIIRFHKFIKSYGDFSKYYNLKKLKRNKNKTYFLSNLEFIKESAEFTYDKLPKVSKKEIIHSDMNCYNLIFSKNKIKGIIDFENYNSAPRIFDLAYTIKMTCFKKKKLNLEWIRAYLKSYSNIHTLPKNCENELLPTILLDNCIYFLRAYEKEKTNELYETVESSKEIYNLLNSEKDFKRFVTTIKLINTKTL